MLVEEALFQILSVDPGLSALVSERIYPVILPETVEYPAIAYSLVSSMDETGLAGTFGLARYRFRLMTITRDPGAYGDAKRVDATMRAALVDYSGLVGDGGSPETFVRIQHIFHAGSAEFYDDPTQTYRVVTDVDVWAEPQ